MEYIIPDDQKGYQCEVILDSISPEGVRLVTMRWKYPLMVHAEACRHRCFSRSVASNRAIPTARILAMVEQDRFTPVYWGKNQAGMSAQEEIESSVKVLAVEEWAMARQAAVESAKRLLAMGVHKQIANRVLNPFQWVTEVVTATDWANFFALRCHPAAQPEMRNIAEMARDAMATSQPREVQFDEWHLPFLDDEDREWLDLGTKKRVSAARVARTSYRTHEGKVSTVEEDLALYERLVGSQPIHASPTEHPATPTNCDCCYYGNLRGWKSHRYDIEGHTVSD